MDKLCILLLYIAIAHGQSYDSNDGSSRDEIMSLPGVEEQPSFKQYSGYLSASETRRYFYWYVESQNNPAEDPIILWLTGGSPCSSLMSIIRENGPYEVSTDGQTLATNPYSWNKIANVVYLETPAGVGFSYAIDGNLTTDDDQMADDNWRAMRDFFELFPELNGRPFFITGESRAGIYLPLLAIRLKDDPSFNFKGVGIANGYVKKYSFDNSILYFWHYHGILGAQQWERLTSTCNCQQFYCEFVPAPSNECKDLVDELVVWAASLRINPYNIHSTCDEYNLLGHGMLKMKYDATQRVPPFQCVAPTDGPFPEERYMRREDVREALHVRTESLVWDACTSVPFTMLYFDMTPQFQELAENQTLRLMLFTGDLDAVCDFLGVQNFADSLGFEESRPHHPWVYTDEYNKVQIGGFARQMQNLTSLTVKGSGHMVASDQPVAALEILRKFLEGEEF